ncbi:nucleoporin subcomplex protein binding to Pom34-domain-containing protein [Chytriomyces sp. MP71]|nr:nucleoporin subcomplex protein binding to Pom34-domain-containing protein [Chytriomyces sp. MP71]
MALSGNKTPIFSSRLQLFQTIERRLAAHSKEALAAYLASQKDSLSRLLDGFQGPNPAARKSVESLSVTHPLTGDRVKITQKESAFVLRVADALQLDETRAFAAVRDVLRNRVARMRMHGSPSTAAGAATTAPVLYDDALLEEVLAHHFEERSAALDVVSALVRCMNDASHPYSEEVKKVVHPIIHDSKFLDTAVMQLMTRMACRVPAAFEQDARKAVFWCTQNLREQRSLLNILFNMFYDEVQCGPAQAVDIIMKLDSTRFGLEQPNAPLFDNESHQMWKDVSHLCILIALTVMDLERAMGTTVSDDDSMDADDKAFYASLNESSPTKPQQLLLTQCPNHIYEITKLLQKYLSPTNPSEGSVYSPLILAWGSLLQKLSSSEVANKLLQDHGVQAASVSVRFVDRANQLGVFQYLYSSTQAYAVIEDNPNVIGYKSVLKGLLTLFVASFNVDDSPQFDAIVTCFTQLFKNSPDLCEQFWLQDYPVEERRTLLDAARSRFPYQQSGLIKFLGSLISSPQTASFVFRYLTELQTYTGAFEAGTVDTFPTPTLAKHYDLAQGLSSRFSLLVKQGKAVQILSAHPPVLHMFMPYSAFHLFVAQMDGFLENPAGGRVGAETLQDWLDLFNAIVEQCTVEEAREVLESVCAVVPTEDEEGALSPSDLICMVCRVFGRACAFDVLPVGLLTACLKTLSLLLGVEPASVWYFLRQEMPIPRYSVEAAGGAAGVGGRYMQQRLLPFERSLGHYDTTLAFLDLVLNMCVESQKLGDGVDSGVQAIQMDVLTSCVKYIHSEVFPTYNSWRYAKLSDKLNIGLKVLQIFNVVLRDFTATTGGGGSGELRQFLVTSYLDGSMFQVAPVLDILGSGSEGPNQFYRQHKVFEGNIVDECVVQALMFVKMLLIERKVSGRSQTLLEHAILDRSVVTGSNQDMTELVHVIASYVSYEFNLSIPLLSMEVLILLCSVAAEWTPRPPSFIGYFGEDALNIVSAFVELASDKPLPAGEESFEIAKAKESIQRAAFSFVTVVIQTQPGLGTLFLTGSETSSVSFSASTSVAGKASQLSSTATTTVSIISAIELILKDWKHVLKDRPSILPSVLKLLEVLWRGAPEFQSALSKLKAISSFWEILLAILNADSPGDESRLHLQMAKSLLYKIFANEVFHSRDASKLDLMMKAFRASTAVESITAIVEKAVLDPIGEIKDKLLSQFQSLELAVDVQKFARPSTGVVEDFFVQLGDNLYYDSTLLEVKLSHPDERVSYAVVDLMKELNVGLSELDVNVSTLKAVVSFIKVCALKIGLSVWGTGSSASGSLLALISILCKQMAKQDRYSQRTLGICSDLSSVVTLLMNIWSVEVSSQKAVDILASSPVLFESLDALRTCFSGSDFRNLIFSGELAAHTFYNQIWTAVLVTLKGLSVSVDTVNDASFYASCGNYVMNVVPYSLRPVEEILSTGSVAGSVADHASVLISVLNESMLLVDRLGASADSCVSLVEQSSVVPLLMTFIYSSSVSRTSDGFSDDFLITECALRLFLVFARVPALADLLSASGLIAAFCNCEISQRVVNGNAPCYVAQDRNPVHILWCLMVTIVTATLRNKTNPGVFFNSVVGFLKLHWHQVDGVFSAPFESMLNCGRLEEIEAYTELMHEMVTAASSPSATEAIDSDFIAGCRERCLRVLNHSVYLLRHPATLSAKASVVSRDELEGAISASGNGKEFQAAFIEHVRALLLLIDRNIVSFICIAYNVEACLTVGNTAFFVKGGLGLGTLSELLTYCVDALSKTKNTAISVKQTQQASSLGDLVVVDLIQERVWNSPSLCFMISQLIGLMISYVIAHDSDGRREAMDHIQQTRSALDILSRDGKGGNSVKELLVELDSFLEVV